MKKKEEKEDPNMIKKILAYMAFVTKLKIAQEDNKREKNKDSNK